MKTNKSYARLTLKDGSTYTGVSFGYRTSVSGEVVFTTGMTGYPESLTDPSYKGQILIFTYPMIGNYGVPKNKSWESDKIHTTAVIVSNYITNNTHHQSKETLSDWLNKEKIPGIEIKDTRGLTQKIREKGALLGKIEFETSIDMYDPNNINLPSLVSIKKPKIFSHTNNAKKPRYNIILIDCGVKKNIIRSLINRGADVTVVPWDFDINSLNRPDGVIISNGPGDPKILIETVTHVRKLLKTTIPILGICLGNQILTLAAGGDTKKMKFGHRSQNQPCKCHRKPRKQFPDYYLTTQNHGFVVSKIPENFKPWFTNANDGTNEGIIHKKKPFMAVQFHPEACPGPTDTNWIFDYFLSHIA